MAKRTIIKLFTLQLLSMFTHQAIANDLVIMKYEFGRRAWVEDHYEKAGIYPLSISDNVHSTSESENLKIKVRYQVSLELVVEEKK